jgi:hypothetical protein
MGGLGKGCFLITVVILGIRKNFNFFFVSSLKLTEIIPRIVEIIGWPVWLVYKFPTLTNDIIRTIPLPFMSEI